MATDELTDKQLVEELSKFGENISLPLKKGKREILIKKLNHFRVREKPPESPKKKSGRSSKKTHDVVSSDDSDVDRISGQSSFKSTTMRRRSAGLPARTSASVEVDDDGFKKPTPRRSRRSEPVFPLFSNKSSASTSTSTSPSSSRGIRDFVDFSRHSKPSTSRGNSYYDPSVETSDSDMAEESVYEVVNKSCNTSLPFDEEESSEEEEEEEEEHKISPRSSTRSRSKGSTKTNTSSLLNSFRSDFNSSFGRNTLPSSRNSSRRSFIFDNLGGKTRKKKDSFLSDHISEGLVVVALIFFVLLIAGYMFVKSDSVFSWYDSVLSKGGVRSDLLLCEDFDEEQRATERCYTREEVDKAMIIIHDLYDLLSTRAGEVECGNEIDKDMTASDFKQQLKDMKHKRKEVARLFNASVDLIMKNPHWKLRVFKDDGDKAISPNDVSTLESTVASKNLVCRISQSFYRVLYTLILVGVVCCVVYFGIHWLRYRTVKSEVEQREIFKMVEDIIDILKENCDKENQSSYMAVQHVRDQLLPPSKRRELQPIWDKAVRFIEANESRIRLESQIIQGEEFEVWKWIHSVPNGGKVWQGQAFGEHNDTATSSLRYSPTPCLKVKNMFDMAVESDEEWYETVENAILEKTQGIADIVHMYVDDESKEGCVYIKCSSREAAGKARQCLHGWWFDGRLITARYLRLEHYHKQFPESVKATRPLRFHKQKPSSLSQPYYRSTLEMT